MKLRQQIAAVLFIFTVQFAVAAQTRTGGIKGKVKVETGTAAGVSVLSDAVNRKLLVWPPTKGVALLSPVQPGMYGLTFRKPGLSVGTVQNVEVKSGKTRHSVIAWYSRWTKAESLLFAAVFSVPAAETFRERAWSWRESLRMVPRKRLTAA